MTASVACQHLRDGWEALWRCGADEYKAKLQKQRELRQQKQSAANPQHRSRSHSVSTSMWGRSSDRAPGGLRGSDGPPATPRSTPRPAHRGQSSSLSRAQSARLGAFPSSTVPGGGDDLAVDHWAARDAAAAAVLVQMELFGAWSPPSGPAVEACALNAAPLLAARPRSASSERLTTTRRSSLLSRYSRAEIDSGCPWLLAPTQRAADGSRRGLRKMSLLTGSSTRMLSMSTRRSSTSGPSSGVGNLGQHSAGLMPGVGGTSTHTTLTATVRVCRVRPADLAAVVGFRHASAAGSGSWVHDLHSASTSTTGLAPHHWLKCVAELRPNRDHGRSPRARHTDSHRPTAAVVFSQLREVARAVTLPLGEVLDVRRHRLRRLLHAHSRESILACAGELDERAMCPGTRH